MMIMKRYEIFQAKWNIDSLYREALNEAYPIRIIYILKFILFLLESITDYFESED